MTVVRTGSALEGGSVRLVQYDHVFVLERVRGGHTIFLGSYKKTTHDLRRAWKHLAALTTDVDLPEWVTDGRKAALCTDTGGPGRTVVDKCPWCRGQLDPHGHCQPCEDREVMEGMLL